MVRLGRRPVGLKKIVPPLPLARGLLELLAGRAPVRVALQALPELLDLERAALSASLLGSAGRGAQRGQPPPVAFELLCVPRPQRLHGLRVRAAQRSRLVGNGG